MIEKIIFDYGGVITKGSRTNFVASSLSTSSEQRSTLREFFRSDFIKQAAEGKWSSMQIVSRLQVLLGDVNSSSINDVLTQACEPDRQMLSLLKQLKARYRVFVISDSLPPYTEYVRQEFADNVDGIFMSDQLGARKSGLLYTLAEETFPGLFTNSVYIDDRESNLPAVRGRGAVGLLFKSMECLVKDLLRLGVVVDE